MPDKILNIEDVELHPRPAAFAPTGAAAFERSEPRRDSKPMELRMLTGATEKLSQQNPPRPYNPAAGHHDTFSMSLSRTLTARG